MFLEQRLCYSTAYSIGVQTSPNLRFCFIERAHLRVSLLELWSELHRDLYLSPNPMHGIVDISVVSVSEPSDLNETMMMNLVPD